MQVLDDGALRFVNPDGVAIDSIALGYTQPIGDWQYLPVKNGEQGVHICPHTAATRWAGEAMDYGLGVQVLMQKVARGRRAWA